MFFSMHDHFVRAQKSYKHYIRAMCVWGAKNSGKSFDNRGVRFFTLDGKKYTPIRPYNFHETMRDVMLLWLTCGTTKQPKEARRKMIELSREQPKGSRIPA